MSRLSTKQRRSRARAKRPQFRTAAECMWFWRAGVKPLPTGFDIEAALLKAWDLLV